MKLIIEIDNETYKGLLTESHIFVKHIFDAVKNGIPIEQEPSRKGHWIITDDDMYVYCSYCGDSYYPRPIDASWYYCPHCGAKMEVSE